MRHSHAITLLELIIVLTIIGALVGLLLPAVQSARQTSREAICKNNLHQLNLATASFVEAYKRLPKEHVPDTIGGWTIEILPFLEQANLEQTVQPGMKISDAPGLLLQPPMIFRCPVRQVLDSTEPATMQPGHYVLVASDRRDSFSLYDAPISLSVPWASGPEMAPRSVERTTGPHREGFFFARGFQQGIDFVEGNRR